MIVQTRSESDNLLIHATRGAVERFYDDEIALRQMLQYPPFSTFILLTWVGTSTSVVELEQPIKVALTDLPVQFYNSPNSSTGKAQRHGLIRIPSADTTLYEAALQKLRNLPPYVKVEIDPERIV